MRATGGDALLAAQDSLEDYAFRYVPRSFRRWSTSAVGVSALGSIAFLADFSIGASIGVVHGTIDAVLGVLLASAIIFVVGGPVAHCAARYNLDLDLVARGAGFGYYGSIITTLVFAGFTCIFFALEGAIMAQGLHTVLGVPLPVGYFVSTVVVVPIVIYGMRALERLQAWTTPLWLVLAVLPLAWLVVSDPQVLDDFTSFTGDPSAVGGGAGGGAPSGPTLSGVVASAAVCFALTPQLAEQVDYLRSMPPRTAENRRSWWIWTVLAGPGWVVFSGLKQVLGVLLAAFLLTRVDPGMGARAVEPVQQFLALYGELLPPWLGAVATLALIVVAQVKINVTNAYSGSLAWLNVWTRVRRTYPGRTIFVVFNLAMALGLMLLDVFSLIGFVLSLYANIVMAWLVTIAVDLVVVRRLLGIGPQYPEFRKGMLHSWNPVGLTSVGLSSVLSLLTFFGAFGEGARSFSVLVAIGVAAVTTPAVALVTRGRWYLRRTDDGIASPLVDEAGNPSGQRLRCHVTGYVFERPDMLASTQVGPFGEPLYVSSLALTLDPTDSYVLPPDAPPTGAADARGR
ncbi:Purine-cytosine permease [Quadrisphaera granulorum]|uniref:Purine-cytosine permease-like protein n=1 Tax=Quadrisphaera granulorum TaxID=317664 RepID=A0A315ZQ01_9ACTN|nr:purine-cytosine permease-like protein [Quadrisphaera granulorum]SZE98819.1 Purine-cytosine permease [Quadrisphaera granulorum]